jgi:hypothetical protein
LLIVRKILMRVAQEPAAAALTPDALPSLHAKLGDLSGLIVRVVLLCVVV